MIHRYIPAHHVLGFLQHGHRFSRCDSFVDLLEFRLGYCCFKGCDSWSELRRCVENTFKHEVVNRTIEGASISCWTECSTSEAWPWAIYGKGDGAIRISVELQNFMSYVRSFGIPGVAGSVTYYFRPSNVRPQFLEPFNNPTGQDRDEHHLFFHKHGFYDYEREFRVVLFEQGPLTKNFPD